jgi:hypothetical protein
MGKIEKKIEFTTIQLKYHPKIKLTKNIKSGERKEAKIKWKSKLHMIENNQIFAP